MFHRQRHILGAALSITMGMLVADLAHAQTAWVGDTSQDWNDPLNWAGDVAPTGNFLINTAAAGVFPVYSADSFTPFFPVDIILGSVAASTARLDQTADNLATGTGNWLIMSPSAGSVSTFNLSGGTFTGRVHMARIGGAAGTATINVSGTGTLTSPGEIVVSDGQNNTATAQGTLNVGAGTTVNSEGDLIGAWAGNASTFGEITIGAGAIVNVASTVERWLIVNQWDAAQGRITVNGGTLNLNANTDIRFSSGNGVGTSFITVNSGAIIGGATSVLDMNRDAAGAVNNTVNLNGGTITMGQVVRTRNNVTGTRAFNFNGGTLIPAGSSAAFFNAGVASAANVRNGGAKFDTNGFDITVGQVLQHSNVGGDLAIDGGLIKSGLGALTFTSSNSYTGPTVVSGGTLNVAGLSATSGVSVAAGAGFGGLGTVVGTTTLNGSALSNTSPATQLTLGAVTFAAGGNTLNVNLSTSSPGIAVTGALTTGGNSATINATKAVWTNGTQSLIGFGSLSGALGNFSLGTLTGLNARQSLVPGSLANTGTALTIGITGDTAKWTGLVSGEWSTAVIANPKNWKTVIGNVSTDYLEGDAVTFDDSATITTLDITSATGVLPTTLEFTNSTKAYTVNASGGSGIGGATSLIKDGTNSLTLNSTNTYAGGTTLKGGTLNLGNASALGTGAFAIEAGSAKTLNNTSGAAIVAVTAAVQTWNDDFTFTGSIDGLSDLDMGAGAVTVGGAGTNRTITVSNGTLAVGELKAAAHGLIKLGAGTLALTSTGPNVAGSNLAGTLHVGAGTVQMNRTAATGGDPNTGDLYVTGLTGTGKVTNGAAQTRWLFVNQAAETTSTFNGTLENGVVSTGPMGLAKQGAGTLTLGGVNTMTDLVTIEAGTLNFTGSGSLAAASGYFLPSGSALLQVSATAQIGSGLINIASNGAGIGPGAGSTARVEISGGSTISAPIQLAPRNDSGGSDAIRNVSGANTINGLITIITGGSHSRIRSEAGSLTLAGGVTTAATGRNFYLQGAGNGEVSGPISNSINVFKQGTGTWTLSAANTYIGLTAVQGGTLGITNSDVLADTTDVSILAGSTLNLPNSTTDTVRSLYLNGVSQLPGTYGFGGIATPLITGSGSLTVTSYHLPGDFDRNNVVDLLDLPIWKTAMTAITPAGDTNGDGVTNGTDFLIWQRNLGATYTPAVASTVSIPEPTSLVGALFASIALAGFRRSRRVAA